MQVIAGALVIGGLFFLTVAVVGVLRLPDFYTRIHAVGKTDTLGGMLLLGGLALYNGFDLVAVKLILILFFLMVANPTGIHALARAAYRTRLRPWTREDTAAPSQSRPKRAAEGGTAR